MIKLIIGVKGTGKTKTLINMVDEALAASKGEVVCIEKGTKLGFDIKHEARLINTNDYLVFDAQSLFGFVAGILASNHDVTDLFIDSALKICNEDLNAFEKLVTEFDELAAKVDVNIVITASLADDAATDTIKKYL